MNAPPGALSLPDRRRFVERVSRRWEVHRHRMAPAVAAEPAVLRDDGRLRIVPAAAVSVLGPARRGTQWESTAVPEIRAHAAALAADITA